MTQATLEIPEIDGDALNPGLAAPTDVYEVAKLTRAQREERLENLKAQGRFIYEEGVKALDGHRQVGSVIMWSGGNDSNVLAHFMRPYATHAFMANTGIGIEKTRQFVRDSAAGWGLPLIEEVAGGKDTYEKFVLRNGYPGPAQHDRMFQRLKQRQIRKARAKLVRNPHQERVIFVGGRRRQESQRRKSLGYLDREGSLISVSPLINWTKADMTTYRLTHDDVPLNGVAVQLGMSGECLCGAMGFPEELDRVAELDPEVVDYIRNDLTPRVRANGIEAPFDQWGHHQGKPPEDPLCEGGCGLSNTDPLWSILDPLVRHDPAFRALNPQETR